MIYHQWSSAVPYFAGAPVGLSEDDANRVRAYGVYEQMYWCHPETFKLIQRGEDSNPIYLPSARGIVEATNRFLAVEWDFVVNPGVGSPADRAALSGLFGSLFRREKMYTKFSMQRRYGLIWGDAIWHITADPTKPPGRRISIHDVIPSRYFPIEDGPRVIGAHLVDSTLDPRDATKTVTRRQTYRKASAGVTTELTLWENGKWDDRNLPPGELKQVATLVPETLLPPTITSLPIYHIKNQAVPGGSFGSSEIRGIESVIAAANQGVTDQDLALAMAGLGVYWTNAAQPRNANGESVDWNIGPTRVARIPEGRTFGRIDGVGSIDPSLEHIRFVLGEAQHGVGVPDIAAGKIDVTIAESGISLRLQMAPLLAKNAEKEQEMLGIYDHMLYDLSTAWLGTYEGFSGGINCEIASVVGEPIPVNRAEVIREVTELATVGLITIEMAHARLAAVGWNFTEGDAALVIEQQRRLAEAKSFDPFANRYNIEIEGATGAITG